MTDGIDYTNKDYRAFKDLMIAKLQEKIPEYTDTSETDAGIAIIEALANGLDILSLYLDITANDLLLPTTQDRSIAVQLANLLGYKPYNQTPSEYIQVFSLEGALAEDILIPKGTVVRTEETQDSESVYFETKYDLIIPAGDIGTEKDLNDYYIYTVPVVQGETINDDIVGSSSGAPLQSFELSYREVIIDTIELYINEGIGPKLWTRVDSFVGCTADSTVYIATLDEFDVCTITFGDGLLGKIPEAYANGISANYRIGGGSVGNVPPNTITKIESSIPFVYSTFNTVNTVVGHDKESLESIKVNAPATFRARDRLVTLQDYSDLLKAYIRGFQDILAVNDEDDKKLVHLYYWMKEGSSYTSYITNMVTQFISERCMIGTTFDIAQGTSESLTIVGVAYINSDYNATTVINQIKEHLVNFFSNSDNIRFKASFVKSKIEEDVKDSVEGVVAFRINTPSGGVIEPSAVNNILTLASGSITITSIAV